MDATEIGATIEAHRRTAGLSRIACARLAGIGKTALFDLEHGKSTVKLCTVLAVLDALNMEIGLRSPLAENSRATGDR